MAIGTLSSELAPAGISSPVTFSLGWAEFQAATTALPQATSSGLFEYQILMAPLAPAALAAQFRLQQRMVEGVELLPKLGVWSALLSARRHGDYLFLRYRTPARVAPV